MTTEIRTASNPIHLPTPAGAFVGRASELSEAEKRLDENHYLVVWGEHGEGKSVFAGELCRRLVERQVVERVVVTSLDMHHDARGVRFEVGQQLVPKFRLAASQDPRLAGQLLERVLEEHPTLVVLDYMQAVMQPEDETAAYEPSVLEHLLAFAAELTRIGGTRVLMTSQAPLPAPFEKSVLHLGRLDAEASTALVRQLLAESGKELTGDDEAQLEDLVNDADGHSWGLVGIAGEIADGGVERARQRMDEVKSSLQEVKAGRHKALLTGVEMSLRRLSENLRAKIHPLAVFRGGGHLTAIAAVLNLDVESDEEIRLAEELIEIGLAEMLPANYMRLHPALGDALRQQASAEELEKAQDAWAEATAQLIGFLYQEQIKNPQLASSLALLELQNLVGCLEHLRTTAEPDDVAELAAAVETLVGPLGRPQTLKHIEKIREEANRSLAAWSHEEFLQELTEVEVLMDCGRQVDAVAAARRTLHRAETLGEDAYDGAAFDLAILYQTLGLALLLDGDSDGALDALEEALNRFAALAADGHEEAQRMEAATLAQAGDCLRTLSYLDAAGDSYTRAIEQFGKLGDRRQVAEVMVQLGTLQLVQVRNREALATFHEAREIFEELEESTAVAEIWQQIGVVHSATRLYEAGEEAFQNALKLQVSESDNSGAAVTLGELGELYDRMRRPEDSVEAYRRAGEAFRETDDALKESIARSQMADKLILLQRYDDARNALKRAIECEEPFGDEGEPWRTYAMLSRLEEEAGNQEASLEAREKAVQKYLSYRQRGGEDKTGHGYIFAEVIDGIREGTTRQVAASLSAMLRRHDLPRHLQALIPALQAILGGSRETSLGHDPALYYRDAAELLYQLEILEQA